MHVLAPNRFTWSWEEYRKRNAQASEPDRQRESPGRRRDRRMRGIERGILDGRISAGSARVTYCNRGVADSAPHHFKREEERNEFCVFFFVFFCLFVFFFDGDGGIRTLGTLLAYTHFPGVLLRPLGHLSRDATAIDPLQRR